MKFSLIIPAYRSQYLRQSIDSVLSQTYRDWELIIVDDCSPEPIGEIVFSYDDSRIRYYRNERNFGAVNLVDNWNSCLEYCTGDYLVCMGDDDVLPENSLKEYSNVIREYPDADVVHGWTNVIDSDSQVREILQQHPSHESVFGFMLRLWKGDDVYAGDILYKLEYLKEKGGFVKMPMAWHSDHLTAFLCGDRNGIASTSKLAFTYRRHSRSISMSSTCMEQKLKADFLTYDWLKKFIARCPTTSVEAQMQKSAVYDFLPHIFELSLCRTIAEGNRRNPIRAIFLFFKLPKQVRSLRLLVRIILHVFA